MPMSVNVTLFLAAAASVTLVSSSECQGATCKVEVPQDEVSLVQTKLESLKAVGPHDLKDAVEAGKRELREYAEELQQNLASGSPTTQEDDARDDEVGLDDAAAAGRAYENFHNATTLGLSYSTSCPTHFDDREASNQATFKFANACLESVQVGSLSDSELEKLSKCSSGKANNVVAYQQDGVECKTKGELYNGGICNAKVYKIKCKDGKVSAKCMQKKLYRGYTKTKEACKDSTGWDCAQPFGAFWAAVNPNAAGISKQDYRERYAVCEGWNAHLDGIWEANVGESTGCGKYVLIGNGEQVAGCPKPLTIGSSSSFAYSPYLQVVICHEPWNLMKGGQDLSVAGWS